MLAVIRHQLTLTFKYQEQILEFIELNGSHIRKNMTDVLITLLKNLDIQYKLKIIIRNNISNNETLISKLYKILQKDY